MAGKRIPDHQLTLRFGDDRHLSQGHTVGCCRKRAAYFDATKFCSVSLSVLYSTDAVGHKGRYNQSVSFFKEACTLTSEKTGVQEEMCRRMC